MRLTYSCALVGRSSPLKVKQNQHPRWAAARISRDLDLQQSELRKPEHKLFLLAQWLGHQPLTQKILLVFPCLRVLGLP